MTVVRAQFVTPLGISVKTEQIVRTDDAYSPGMATTYHQEKQKSKSDDEHSLASRSSA